MEPKKTDYRITLMKWRMKSFFFIWKNYQVPLEAIFQKQLKTRP